MPGVLLNKESKPTEYWAPEPSDSWGDWWQKSNTKAILQTVYDAVYAIPPTVYGAVTLPGDVYQGNVDPRSDEAIQRAADLAGMVTLGAGAIPAEANSLRMGIKAYHGSPHDFDKFELSDKTIGTGEGAQAYGHGLYFAEREGVARDYRDTLAAQKNIKVGQDALQNPGFGAGATRQAYYSLVHARGDIDQAIRNASAATNAKEVQEILQKWKVQGVETAPGRVYEVDIAAEPEHFLDWDRPLSEQPKAVEALKKSRRYQELAASRHFGYSPEEFAALPAERRASLIESTPESIHENILYPERPGRGLYDSMGPPQEATQMFQQAGIPGIRFLDQGSRKAGAGTGNYVVFDDSLISILKKYGVVGPALAAWGVSMSLPDSAAAQE